MMHEVLLHCSMIPWQQIFDCIHTRAKLGNPYGSIMGGSYKGWVGATIRCHDNNLICRFYQLSGIERRWWHQWKWPLWGVSQNFRLKKKTKPLMASVKWQATRDLRLFSCADSCVILGTFIYSLLSFILFFCNTFVSCSFTHSVYLIWCISFCLDPSRFQSKGTGMDRNKGALNPTALCHCSSEKSWGRDWWIW